MAGKVLGVYSYNQSGECIGNITMRKGKLVGSTEGVQSLADSQLKRHGRDPKATFDALDGWSNGYLWIERIKNTPLR